MFQCTINKTGNLLFSQKYSAAGHLRFFYRGEQEEQNIISFFLSGWGLFAIISN
ncbi:hypothetical protein HMPREF3217_00507 [Finegoldia magna]|nr:hypothetical protein HMPREF3217_00507 [Finegoldia magna]